MAVLVFGFVVAVLDQVTKYAVRMSFAVGESRPVVPGLFDLTYVKNTGAAWGILGGQNSWLIILSIIMLLAMLIFRRSFLTDTWEHRISLGLILGGIVGNLLDRLRLGFVSDFLDFYWKGHHWPAFNIADAAICVGVGLYIVSSFWINSHPLNGASLKQAKDDPAKTG